MTRRSKRIVLSIVLAPFALAALFAVFFGLRIAFAFCYWLATADDQIRQRQRTLLYHTNHANLYHACMYVLDHRDRFRQDMAWSNPTDTVDPRDPALPPVILHLKPGYIRIDGDRLRIEMGGGFYHYGIDAYRDPAQASGGLLTLHPGLLFYDEQGIVTPPQP